MPYEIRFDADGDPIACHFCRYECVPLDEFTFRQFKVEPKQVLWCEVCSMTYLTLDEDHERLARSIGWIANRILEEVKRGKA